MKVLLISQNKTDATSFYRGYGPLSQLAKDYEDVELIDGAFIKEGIVPVDWSVLTQIDLLYMQRPATPDVHRIMHYAKFCNVPIISDFDDDIFAVQEDNPTGEYFNQHHDLFKEIMELSSHIIVSTPFIKDSYMKKGIKVPMDVIPNGFHADFLRTVVDPQNSTRKVLWRGGHTHKMDLYEHADSIIDAFNETVGWEMVFFGEGQDWINVIIGQHMNTPPSTIPYIDTIHYFDSIVNKVNPKIMIVPLVNNDFNWSKSNITILEANYAGAVPIVPEYLPEFDVPGVIKYEDVEDLHLKLKAAMRNKFPLNKLWKETNDYIRKNLLVKDLNKKRYDIIKSLV